MKEEYLVSNPSLPKYVEIIYKNIKFFVSETSTNDDVSGKEYTYDLVKLNQSTIITREHIYLNGDRSEVIDLFYPLYNSRSAINESNLAHIAKLLHELPTNAKAKNLYMSILSKDGTVLHILIEKL